MAFEMKWTRVSVLILILVSYVLTVTYITRNIYPITGMLKWNRGVNLDLWYVICDVANTSAGLSLWSGPWDCSSFALSDFSGWGTTKLKA